MTLNLIYSWNDSCIVFQLLQVADLKIADTNRKSASCLLDIFQYFPGADVTSRNRPVDQIQINIIQLQTIKTSLKGSLDIPKTLSCVPYLAGDEEFASRNSTSGDATSDVLFIFIYGSGVDQTISGFYCRNHCILCFVFSGSFVYPETK